MTDEATLRLVRELGVDYAQGHHIGRPGDLADALSGEVISPADRAA